MSDDYYPWEIVYSQRQFRWLLSPMVWNMIKIRQWPFSIQDDVLSRAGVSHHAAFEMISMIKIEMEERLESVSKNKDGDMCVARYYNEDEDERIARKFGVPYGRVGRRIYRAMRYMAGWRKRCSYGEWINNGWSETPRVRRRTEGDTGYEIKGKTHRS